MSAVLLLNLSHIISPNRAWGRIIDEESLKLIDSIYELPVTSGAGGMHYLDKPIKFTMSTSP